MPIRRLFRSLTQITTSSGRDHGACGVGLVTPIASPSKIFSPTPTHSFVQEGLDFLRKVDYRSGYNPITEESDGAGIRLYALPLPFFQNAISEGKFLSPKTKTPITLTLSQGRFAIGQYFLPTQPIQQEEAKTLIERCAAEQGLQLAGWRNLESDLDLSAISKSAAAKKPALYQAILIQKSPGIFNLELATLKAAIAISNEAAKARLPLNIVSQSSESIVYKGMVRPTQLGAFFKDLCDPTFTSSAVSTHARFATNTDPQWANAQPCVFFWNHNGELNSAGANAREMRAELKARNFSGIYPNGKLSDSMQFDADLANQIALRTCSLAEAFVRLMPPSSSADYSPEIRAMLEYFSLERSPYNGPSFAVAGFQGYYLAKLDAVGLRPSRWAITEDSEGHRYFHAGSDDTVSAPPGGKIIHKGHLEPGGMMMITPEGSVLNTAAVLDFVRAQYHDTAPSHFQDLVSTQLVSLKQDQSDPKPLMDTGDEDSLNRSLWSSFWDYESQTAVVQYMAENGAERVAAMGDDTNPLHSADEPLHISYFFHQLFAQVSAPPLDSIKERERFNLSTFLGAMPGQFKDGKQIKLGSPILGADELALIEHHSAVNAPIIDISFAMPSKDSSLSSEESAALLRNAIKNLLKTAEEAAQKGGILILSDRNIGPDRAAIPDMIAVAALRQHLEAKNLMHAVSIVADSHQITGPHQASALLAVGARAVYARAAYLEISKLSKEKTQLQTLNDNYKHALEKCLLKTMGKMGITDVNNYSNGKLIAAMGLDLDSGKETSLEKNPSLATIFPGLYSPLKGLNLGHIAQQLSIRHHQAYNPENDFSVLPRSGYYFPEKGGLKHGYGPEVINAFTDWLNKEEVRAKLLQLHTRLERKGFPDFVKEASHYFSSVQGFLDPRKKNEQGFYPPDYLEGFKPSEFFTEMCAEIERYRRTHPTSISDHLSLNTLSDPTQIIGTESRKTPDPSSVQSQEQIRATLFSGSMSQGALTVTNPDTPEHIGAHESLTRGMNAIGAKSASGEGGEAPQDLQNPLTSTYNKQIASGRFGISAEQMRPREETQAIEIEIKMAQGAKPGEGGQLPGTKLSVRFAAQRGAIPGTDLISPPPHHDIYSIEDLEQLIHDLKSVNPHAKVAVKLVASEGIGTIAVGVAKAGADVINIAGNSGGTGAAQQSSIKHGGLAAEIGLVEVDRALRKTRLRDTVQLRTSGGFKTAEDVIKAAILGADLFEFGSTAMLTLGCKMQRTCNHSCQPGVATDGHLFKGDQLNTERFFVNIAAAVQERLQELGFSNLRELRGHTELLQPTKPEFETLYNFSALLAQPVFPEFLNPEELHQAEQRKKESLRRVKEEALKTEIDAALETEGAHYQSTEMALSTADRSFGARIAGDFVHHLKKNPHSKIILSTGGLAGQSYGFALCSGMKLEHKGSVQDGCGKSMTGGTLIVRTPSLHEEYRADENTVAGNALFYGASGGKGFINGIAGHRFGILLKGAQVVVEGVGDLALEYMTSGTAMILGKVGKGLGNGSSGGIIFVYDPENTLALQVSDSLRFATETESPAYTRAIHSMLEEHAAHSDSSKAKALLVGFNPNHFKILIPKELDKIKTIQDIIKIIKTQQLQQTALSIGMQVWLEQKTLSVVNAASETEHTEQDELHQLWTLLRKNSKLFSKEVRDVLLQKTRPTPPGEDFGIRLPPALTAPLSLSSEGVIVHPKTPRPVQERLSSIAGLRDEVLRDALEHIQVYAQQLSHDAQGCSGCRTQSCAGGEEVDSGCPGGKSINSLNAILKRLGSIDLNKTLNEGHFRILREAFEIQIQATPFIAYTGAACPAPCESACTETIATTGLPDPKRAGKLIGEPVHIKDIEYYLYQVGRAQGWFDSNAFGFKAPFRKAEKFLADKEIIIVGSGPAAMQMAFEALRDGIKVYMYEKSDKAGGLLADGIPAHKFDKQYVQEDFERLKKMGLELHLKSEVIFEGEEFRLKGSTTSIARANDPHQRVVLCVGAGAPKKLPAKITEGLEAAQQSKIIQAIDFLKAANDVAEVLDKNPDWSTEEREALIQSKLGSMDPRGKKVVVVGGGDTAQDVTRWLVRYLKAADAEAKLQVLVRGPEVKARGTMDAYPRLSLAPTKENNLRAEEIHTVQGSSTHCVEPEKISADLDGKLTLTLKESKFKYIEAIEADPTSKKLFDSLPREQKPRDKSAQLEFEGVDMIICALGFEEKSSISLVQAIEAAALSNVHIAGDAAGIEQKIIIGAQASATHSYKQVKSALGIPSNHALPRAQADRRTGLSYYSGLMNPATLAKRFGSFEKRQTTVRFNL